MKEKIAEAFVSLVEENKTYKVNVEAICKKAGISKTTFYKYFTDKYAVTEYIYEQEVSGSLDKAMYVLSKDGKNYIRELTPCLFANICGKKEFYRILIAETGQNSFQDFIIRYSKDVGTKYLKHFENNKLTALDLEYFSYCYGTFFVSILKKWLNDDRSITPEKLTKYFFLEFD